MPDEALALLRELQLEMRLSQQDIRSDVAALQRHLDMVSAEMTLIQRQLKLLTIRTGTLESWTPAPTPDDGGCGA